jgi:acyl-CoA thioesterase
MMQDYLDFFRDNDHFARHCGFELLEVKPGSATAKMVIQPFHFNGARTVHGGALFALADFVFAAAVNSRGQLALAINTSMAFINAALGGTLVATAQEVSCNRRLGVYQVDIHDEQGQLIARFQGTAYRKSEPLLAGGEEK